MNNDKPKSLQARSMPPIKLKDKSGRGAIFVELKKVFGFIPEVICVQKVQGQHDTVVISAILTDEELELEKHAKIQPAKKLEAGSESSDKAANPTG